MSVSSKAASFCGLVLCCCLTCAPLSWTQSAIDDIHVTPREASAPAAAVIDPALNTYTEPIRTNVDLVLVPVTITDPLNRLVVGLGKDNFRVFDGKKPQEIKHFSSEDAPVSLGIIMDTSGSMKGKMDRVREAITQFCDQANPQDEFFMITFSDMPRLAVDFTPRPEEVQSQLLSATIKGRTSLLDAIYMGVRKMREAKYPRKALLIISDGGDNHSRYTERELKSLIKEADVTIYAVGTFERAVSTQEELLGPLLLSDIAEVTGGQAFSLDNPNDLPAVTSRVGSALRHQYVLAYHPDQSAHDGKWHKIHVKLKAPSRLNLLRVHAKDGYYAPSQ